MSHPAGMPCRLGNVTYSIAKPKISVVIFGVSHAGSQRLTEPSAYGSMVLAQFEQLRLFIVVNLPV